MRPPPSRARRSANHCRRHPGFRRGRSCNRSLRPLRKCVCCTRIYGQPSGCCCCRGSSAFGRGRCFARARVSDLVSAMEARCLKMEGSERVEAHAESPSAGEPGVGHRRICITERDMGGRTCARCSAIGTTKRESQPRACWRRGPEAGFDPLRIPFLNVSLRSTAGRYSRD